MVSTLPKSIKAIVVRKSKSVEGFPYDAALETLPIPNLGKKQILVKINAVAFNHRDLWIRRGQYPGIIPGCTFGADGAGVVVASSDSSDSFLQKRVFLLPMHGWESDPEAPESKFNVIGGGGYTHPLGTFSQYVAVDRDQVIPSPDHLTDEQVSAWPLGGVTAWRAAIVNAQVKSGDNVLITGIGGGVALIAMQLCLARGASVYVTSGGQDKIDKAVGLGAKGGVSYKDKNWPSQLAKLLAETGGSELNAVIDSGGGDIVTKVSKVVKSGGRFVIYGMTASPEVKLTMREVLKNHKVLGSTMGSHKDLIDATNFIAENRVVPAVSHVLEGFEEAEEGFRLLQQGDHFGKIVMRVKHDQSSAREDDTRVPTKL